MDAAQMAQGTPPQGTIAPGQAQVGGDIGKVMEALSAAVQQAVNEQGYVDLDQLTAIWPQISQQMGVNVPFQTVMQLVNQNPDIVGDIVAKHGLAGIVVNGKHISAEQLSGTSSGATAGQGVA